MSAYVMITTLGPSGGATAQPGALSHLIRGWISTTVVFRWLLAATTLVACLSSACADGVVQAVYDVSLLGVPVLSAEVETTVRGGLYSVHAKYRSVGAMRMVGMTGDVSSRGTYREGRLIPTSFNMSHRSSRSKRSIELAMTDKGVTSVKIEPPLNGSDLQPRLDRGQLEAAIDPLSALLLPVSGQEPSAATCSRSFSAVDGLRRYEITFEDGGPAPKADAVFSGPARNCNVLVRIVAGGSPEAGYEARRPNGAEATRVQATFGRVAGFGLDLPIAARATTTVGAINVVLSKVKVEASLPANPR